MADQSHLDVIAQGVEAWNSWRGQNPSTAPDLSEADLSEVDRSWTNLSEADLSGANLSKSYFDHADLSWANLYRANLFRTSLSWANLYKANLSWANLFQVGLSEADLSGANLSWANLSEANVSWANLSEADLSGADLSSATLTRSNFVDANLEGATIEGCRIYGIAAWNLKLEGAKQQNLNISDYLEPDVMVDDLEVAQFIYLLLNNGKIRQVIDTITSKVVLILGRFTAERKVVLETIRDSLRQRGYLPVLFDFDKPTSRDLTETVSTLAHMARFIIVDITDAKSISQELQTIVPNLPSVPVQPLLLASDYEYGMFEHFKRYPWVLAAYVYENPHEVLAALEAKIISPAETKALELSK